MADLFLFDGDFVASLVQELVEGEDVDFKLAFIKFINALLISFEDWTDRVNFRTTLINHGMTFKVLQDMLTDYADNDNLVAVINIYFEETENDGHAQRQAVQNSE